MEILSSLSSSPRYGRHRVEVTIRAHRLHLSVGPQSKAIHGFAKAQAAHPFTQLASHYLKGLAQSPLRSPSVFVEAVVRPIFPTTQIQRLLRPPRLPLSIPYYVLTRCLVHVSGAASSVVLLPAAGAYATAFLHP